MTQAGHMPSVPAPVASWSVDLLGFSSTVACSTVCCFPCASGAVTAAMPKGSGVPCAGSYTNGCFFSVLCPGVSTGIVHNAIRRHYQIRGNDCISFALGCMCPCCAACQHAAEIAAHAFAAAAPGNVLAEIKTVAPVLEAMGGEAVQMAKHVAYELTEHERKGSKK